MKLNGPSRAIEVRSLVQAARCLITIALILAVITGSRIAGAQAIQTADAIGSASPLTETQIQDLVAPIALYPDDLVSIILPASTYPLQIVQAARFLDALEEDPSLEPDIEWDNSIVALLNYPEVLRMLDADLDWTWDLGQAVLNQQAQVLEGIQDFRERAYLAGNLQSDDRQTVTEEEGVIEIEPADPLVVYVPYYEPEKVVVRQTRPVFGYYSHRYPLYYYPYPIDYSFGSPYFWGVTSAFSIGWHSHYLNVHHHNHAGHPYYGRSYYSPYYWRRGVNININLNHESHIWRPQDHRAARPNYGSNDRRIVRTSEEYSNSLRRARQNRIDRTESSRARTNRSNRRVNSGTSGLPGNADSINRLENRPVSDRNTRRTATDSTRIETASPARNQRRAIGSATDRSAVLNNSRRASATNDRARSAQQRRRNSISGAERAMRTTPQRNRRNTPTFSSGQSRQMNTARQNRSVTAAPRQNRAVTAPRQSRPRTMASPSRAAPTRAPRPATRSSNIRTGNGRLPRRN